MSTDSKFKVKVTQLRISKPFLKIVARDLRVNLEDLKGVYDKAQNLDIILGDICIAYLGEGKYERCRVIRSSGIDSVVAVSFFDSGIHGEMPRSRLRILQDDKLKKIPPLSTEYILAWVSINVNHDYSTMVKKFHDEIINKNFNLEVLKENKAGKFVDLKSTKKSVLNDFIPNHRVFNSCFKLIILENQMEMMEKKMMDNESMILHQRQTLVESPEIQSRNQDVFMKPGAEHSVRITAYDDNSLCFHVQLKAKDDQYQFFQSDLQKYRERLCRIESPKVGQKCLVLIENELFRGEIKTKSGIKDKEECLLVHLLENGNKVLIASQKIYILPTVVSSQPPFARKFMLHGSITQFHRSEIVFYFQHITNNKILGLKSVSGQGSVPSCKLNIKNVDVFEELKRWSPHDMKYLPSEPLMTNVTFNVIVCSVKSLNQFYVIQKETDNYDKYLKLLDNLQRFSSPKICIPKVGDACLIKIDGDNMRCQIIDTTPIKAFFKCQAVDTGFIDEFHQNEINIIVQELLKLPPMSILCCLNGYEFRKEEPKILKLFAEKCGSDLELQMRVVKKCGEKYIVELEDSNGNKLMNVDENALMNNSDWDLKTEWTPSHSFSIDNRRNDVNLLNETLHTFIESPSKCSDFGEDPLELVKTSSNQGSINLDDLDSFMSDDENFKEVNQHGNDDMNWNEIRSLPTSKNSCISISQAVLLQRESNGNSSSTSMVMPSTSSSSSGIGTYMSDIKLHGEPAKITAILKPTDFTIQKLCNVSKYGAFLKNIQEIAEARVPLTAFAQYSHCLAFNRLNNKWCRAVILDVSNSKNEFQVSVKCIDDGNTFTIQEKNELKCSSINLVFNNYFGIRCSLPIRVDPSKEQKASDYLLKIMNANLSYQPITKYSDRLIIDLYHDGNNVADALLKENMAKRHFYAPTGQGFINFVASITDFSVQFEDVSELMDQVIDYIDGYNHCEIQNPKVGMIVIAKYKEDNCWYRAKIEKIMANGYKVNFLDHGHLSDVDEIGAMTNPTISSIAPLAHKCSLINPKGFNSFSEHAEKKFKELANNGKTKFYIRFEEPGITAALVSVFYDSENIVKQLNIEH